MAKKTVRPAATPAGLDVSGIDPEAIYRVTLKRPIRRGRLRLRPTDQVELKGSAVLEEVASITAAVKIR